MLPDTLRARAAGAGRALADATAEGEWAGSGMTPAGGTDPTAGVVLVAGGRPQAQSTPDPERLDRPKGTPRPARGGAAMSVSPEFDPFPLHDGTHSEVTNRPVVTVGPVSMLPWDATPRPVFRQVPPTDAANVPDVC